MTGTDRRTSEVVSVRRWGRKHVLHGAAGLAAGSLGVALAGCGSGGSATQQPAAAGKGPVTLQMLTQTIEWLGPLQPAPGHRDWRGPVDAGAVLRWNGALPARLRSVSAHVRGRGQLARRGRQLMSDT
ncbi:MAG: hypothetical protein HY332_17845 [Chloroflexi bacterium]|nr:hypothetical protein [Chloroflexota bacterium]